MTWAAIIALFLAPALPLPRTRPRPLVVGGLVPTGAALDDPSAAVAALLPAALPTFCFLVLREGELVDAYDSPFFLIRLGDDGVAADMDDDMAAVARADMASAAIMAAMSLSLSSSLPLGLRTVFGAIAAASALVLPFPFFLLVLDFFSELPPPPPLVDIFVAALAILDVGVGVRVSSSLTFVLALALFRAQ